MKTFLLLTTSLLLLCFTIKKSSKKKSLETFKNEVFAFENDSIIKPIHQESKEYFLSKKNNNSSNLNETIYLKNNEGKLITEFIIEAETDIESKKVIEITNHNLLNVNKILKIAIYKFNGEYNDDSTKEIYILKTYDNQYIQLPHIEFIDTEHGRDDAKYEYKFGKLNTIFYMEKFVKYSYDYSTKTLLKTDRKKKLIWNGEEIISNEELNFDKFIVTAKNGLTIRDQPSLKGKKIGGLPYKTETAIQEITSHTLEITDEGKLIKGNWVKVENDLTNEWSVGYVFDGFLEEKEKFKKNSTKILFHGCYQDSYRKEYIDDLNSKWLHLYKRDHKYYLTNPIFTKKRSYNECTGDSLNCLSSSKETILFIKRPSIKNDISKINSINIPKDVIWSGEEFSFEFNNQNYTLKASGNFPNLNTVNHHDFKKDYTLTIQSGGKSEIMFQQNIFEDTVPKIIFIGDIDGDNKPDIIIDSPRNYEESRKILFLSSDAKDNKLIEKSAEMSFGFSC